MTQVRTTAARRPRPPARTRRQSAPTAAEQARRHETWLKQLTSLPTASGLEGRVVAWVERWVAARPTLILARDRGGNLFVTQRAGRTRHGRGGAAAPLFITAHLDHPAFVVTGHRGGEVELEFRGSVHDAYFGGARIEIHDARGASHRAVIQELDANATPFKRVTARLSRPAAAGRIAEGDIGRWAFTGLPRVVNGLLHTHGCDDLAGVAAALAALDRLRRMPNTGHIGVLLTRAEEVGFIGAIAACRAGSIPRRARLVCLETSRSFPESPIGAGPILRVGDRSSVFEPTLTNAVGALMTAHEASHPEFRWQRKLMPGGTCEATTFSTYGYQATCLCLALGNYHNMTDIDAVLAGRVAARVGPEFISVADFHGLVEMLVVVASRLDAADRPQLKTRMEELFRERGYVLRG